MRKAYVVSTGDDPNKTWGWIAAESASEIESTFRDLTIHEPPPAWATAKLMADFDAYQIDGPLDAWLEKLRRKRP